MLLMNNRLFSTRLSRIENGIHLNRFSQWYEVFSLVTGLAILVFMAHKA
jgi:hypothetical protein